MSIPAKGSCGAATPTITGKTVKVGTKSFDSMFAELRELHAGAGLNEVPKGGFNSDQYAEANGVTAAAAYNYCNRLFKAGKLKKHLVRDASCSNGARLRTYFVKAG